MSETTTEYKGVTLKVQTTSDERPTAASEVAQESELYIDGQRVPATVSANTRYWTYLLPYQDYHSLTELGEAVIDHVHGRVAEEPDTD